VSFSKQGVKDLLAGAVPSTEISFSDPLEERAWPPEGGRWTMRKLRKELGVELASLRKFIKENENFQKLLDIKFNHLGWIVPDDAFVFTIKDLEKAKKIVDDQLKRQWTAKSLSKRLGYNKNIITKITRENKEFATLIRADRNQRGQMKLPRDLKLTLEDLQRAAVLIEKHFAFGRWAPRLGYDCCQHCGTTEAPHQRKGLCTPCDWKRNRGELIFDNSYWSAKYKIKRCKNCNTCKKPHYQLGYCQACFVAIVKRGKDPKYTPARSEKKRRKWKDATP
jgi:hypothetical protein